MILLLVLVLLRLLLRNSWAAGGVFLVVFAVVPNLGTDQLMPDLGVGFLVMGLTLFVLLRVGLLAMMALTLWNMFGWRVGALDPDSWIATDSMVVLAVLLTVPLVAAVIASRGRGSLQHDV